jgi:hypothetical protein
MSEAGWARAAGLFEGEGSVVPVRPERPKYVRLVVKMTDEDVIRSLHEHMGCGTVRYYEPGVGLKPTWTWSTGIRTEVTRICKEMEPWLHSRRLNRIRELGIL